MSIHFDFTVSDVDAENIINIIKSESQRCVLQANEYASINEPEMANWYREHSKYLLDLIPKMTNRRVP